ncbi:MAG TPA: SDR family oxidoreductase [Actinomycetota bacterium]|nr:SDR family oxidoreductase [Actinomycetota bacterium]
MAGKRICMTGATGFLGTALLQRLLIDIPVERIDLLIRRDGPARLKTILSGSAFKPTVEAMGVDALRELAAAKVRPLTADLTKPDTIPVADDIDLIIHTAATVSFDPAVDDAFETNLKGTLNLYNAGGGKPFLHVSTAYVAGLTRGTQPEELLVRRVRWRAEAESASRARDDIEADSRRPELLASFESKARKEIGRAGPQSVAKRAEQFRRNWERDRLVEYGRARARSLGWPDAYTFTKALTELALDETAGDNPLAIVRPSIIESALERPTPGWIEGFRMAEPVILAFGRGALPEFPGIPEGVLDVIPVDLVVNAILAVAASPPKRRAVHHVSSGSRNPLKYRDLYDYCRAYFLDDPLPERGRGAYKVPVWTFPGRLAVKRKMDFAEKAISTAEKAVGRLPHGEFARKTARRVDDLRGRLDFAKRYAELYGPYVEAEVIYTDLRTKELFETLPAEDQAEFGFDPACYTWAHYFRDIHLPQITRSLRRVSPARTKPAVKLAPPARDQLVLAVYDIDRVIVASNVIEPYLWLRMAEQDGFERAREFVGLAGKGPGFLSAERRDRGEFLRKFYRLYEGASAAGIRALADTVLPELMLKRMAPAAIRRIRQHRALGHRVILMTAGLDFCFECLRPLCDELVCASLGELDGVFTGDLARPPLVGEARASWLNDYARDTGADLSASYGYADSLTDLPMLEAVGHPVAVNPEVPLARMANSRRWPVEIWEPGKGTPKVLVPPTPEDFTW